MPLAQVLPCPQLIFPSKTWFFGIYLNFQWQKIHFKNQFLPHSKSKSYQINSIKSCCSSRSFQQHQKAHSNSSKKFQLQFNLIQIFSEEIIWYFKNFCTTSPNIHNGINKPMHHHPFLSRAFKKTSRTTWSPHDLTLCTLFVLGVHFVLSSNSMPHGDTTFWIFKAGLNMP